MVISLRLEKKQLSSAWKRKTSPPPLKGKVQKSGRKNMFIFFMDVRDMLLLHAVPEGKTVNAQNYAKVRCFKYFFALGI